MRAGALREKITLLAKSVSRDSLGAEVVTWASQFDAWAAVQPIAGREYTTLQAAQSDITIRFRTRYRSGVDTGMRVRWRERDYDIVEAINVGARDAELELLCTGDAGDA